MKQLYIDKNEWLECVQTIGEEEIINKYVESKWYTEDEYNDLITTMRKDAVENYDDKTWYIISYYLDFEDYYNEIKDIDDGKLVKN